MRVVSGGQWTTDGRWVVIGDWHHRTLDRTFRDVILYDPGNHNPFLDLFDCNTWLREHAPVPSHPHPVRAHA